jgi:hypothetical protein
MSLRTPWCAILLAACGSSSISVAPYAAAQRDAYCRHLVVCGELESFDACKTMNLGVRFGPSASQRAAVDMGAVQFDGDRAQACVDALGARGCDPTREDNRRTPDACFDVLRGTLHADAACGIDEECISRSCDVPDCDMACCTGTCAGDEPPVPGALGESCAAAGCQRRLFCDADVDACVALQPLGGFCASSDQCREGFYCDPVGECAAALPALHAVCTMGCRDEGTRCSETSHTCVEVGLAGAPCVDSSECSPLYRCDATLHCSAGLPLGAPCTGTDRCVDIDAFCDIPLTEAVGTCTLPKDDGAPCQTDRQCQGDRCDPQSHLCAAAAICL